jgi:hypothetical protein
MKKEGGGNYSPPPFFFFPHPEVGFIGYFFSFPLTFWVEGNEKKWTCWLKASFFFFLPSTFGRGKEEKKKKKWAIWKGISFSTPILKGGEEKKLR